MVARPSPDPRLFAALGDATRLSLIDQIPVADHEQGDFIHQRQGKLKDPSVLVRIARGAEIQAHPVCGFRVAEVQHAAFVAGKGTRFESANLIEGQFLPRVLEIPDAATQITDTLDTAVQYNLAIMAGPGRTGRRRHHGRDQEQQDRYQRRHRWKRQFKPLPQNVISARVDTGFLFYCQ